MKRQTQKIWAPGTCLLILLTACSRPAEPSSGIEGQIMILEAGGRMLRPVGVPVMLVKSNVAADYVQAARRESTNSLPNLSKQAAEVDKDLALQVSHQKALLENLDGLYQSRQGLTNALGKVSRYVEGSSSEEVQTNLTVTQREEHQRDVAEIIDNTTVLRENLGTLRRREIEWRTQLNQISNRITELKARRAALDDDLTAPATRALVTQPWPGALQTQMTDAEGKFALNPPAGTNVLVVALGKRELLGAARDYLWILPARTRTGTPLLLNNANLFYTGESSAP